MIFNKEYDNSLWTIINGDKQHNHLITNFIHELPKAFIDQIRKAIKERENIFDIISINPNLLPNYPKILSGTSELIDNVKYTYILDMDFGELKIMKTIKKDNSYDTVLTLQLEQMKLPLIGCFDGGLIGYLEYHVKEKKYFQDFPVINNYRFEYGISKNMFEHLITTDEICGDSRLRSKQSIDINQLPRDLNIENIPVITKKLSIERMAELEQYLRNETNTEALSPEDISYLEIAKKFPLDEILKDREYYVRNFAKLDEIKYTQYLMEKYSCTKEELFNRYITVNAIRKYNNKLFNHMYKIRKKTIKQLTK